MTIFYDGGAAILRTIATGAIVYVALILILRVSGKRTLSKWNAFDFIITIALGSTLATALLSKDTAIAQGVTGLALLIALQFVVTWLSVRFRSFSQLVKARPTLLVYRGELRTAAMRRQRVTEGEVLAALRGHGIGSVAQAAAVILETDGSFSVIRELDENNDASALADVDQS